MAYNELVKNFKRIRDYMREFYVYGFKSRDEFTKKSARSYDDERRRLESWLGDYMQFRQTAEGKNTFLFREGVIINMENKKFYRRRYYLTLYYYGYIVRAGDKYDNWRNNRFY